MQNLIIILRREFRGFFLSPFGWIVLTLVTVMQGWSMSTAMNALQKSAFAKIVQVLADGLRRHSEVGGQRVNAYPALAPGQLNDIRLSGRQRFH